MERRDKYWKLNGDEASQGGQISRYQGVDRGKKKMIIDELT